MFSLTLALLFTTPLIEAVKAQDADVVRELVERRVDVNVPEGDGATALHHAVYLEDAALVGLLLIAGATPGVANDLGITPLHLASAAGNARLVAQLLERGAAADVASEAGVTPLMEAARAGNADAVRTLLARGAKVNAAERSRGQTALMWAVARQHPEVVSLLVEAGADLHTRTAVRPVTVMLDQGPRRTVKTSKQDARQIDAGGSTALHFAAQVGDAESATRLLAGGAKVDDLAADGRTALVLAAFAGHPSVAQVLIDAGAKLDSDEAGYTALHAAVLRGDLETVKALLVKGANPNLSLTKGSPVRRFGSQWALPSTLHGATPLLVAATYLEVDIVRALLAGGADPQVPIANGTTPLLAAAGAAVEKEARPTDLARWQIVDSDTPLVPRAQADAVEVTRLLLDAGAPLAHANAAGDTALHAAAAIGEASVIQLLAERGASFDAKNAIGQTPLALTLPKAVHDGRPTAASGMPEIEQLLRKLGARY